MAGRGVRGDLTPFRVAAAILLAGLPAQAMALSIAARRAHQPDLACVAVDALLTKIAEGRAAEIDVTMKLVTDRLGATDWSRRREFRSELTTNDGKPDRVPLRLQGLYRLGGSKFDPVYVAVIERDMWIEQRFRYEGPEGEEAVRLPPDYETRPSYWLVAFSSDAVFGLRETPEAQQLIGAQSRSVCPSISPRDR